MRHPVGRAGHIKFDDRHRLDGLSRFRYMPISVQSDGEFRYMTTSLYYEISVGLHATFGVRLRYIISMATG